MFAVDAGLWELNRVLAVTCRLCGSCQNEAIVKFAIQNVSIQHEVQNIARAASAAPAASFKSANRTYGVPVRALADFHAAPSRDHLTSPSFCTTASERVYITARAFEFEFGGTKGL